MTAEAVTLIESVKDQIHQRMQPSTERLNIDLLLDNFSVYAKRVNGLPLNEAELQLPAHHSFSGLVAVPQQRAYESLIKRLRMILRFRITSYDKVARDLLIGLFPKRVDQLTTKDIRLLSMLHSDPMCSPVKLAKNLNVTAPTIRKQIKNLEEKAGLRFANIIDWRQFKLRQFNLFFITHDATASRQLEHVLRNQMSPYLTTAVFDTTYLRGYAGFRIPDQTKPTKLFLQQLHALEDAFFEVSQVHDITASYVVTCFDHFDYETGDWLIEGDVTTLGLLNFVRENWKILPRPQGMQLTESRPFDQLDYYLAAFLIGDGRARMEKLLARLKGVGINSPRTTVSTRKNKLLKERAMHPVILFNSPLLPFFVSYAIKCDKQIAEEVVLGVAQMPHAFAYLSDIGCIVNVNVPLRSLGPTLHLLSMLREEEGVEEVWQMQQYRNLGSADPAILGSKWNGNYWEWSEDEFSLPSLGYE